MTRNISLCFSLAIALLPGIAFADTTASPTPTPTAPGAPINRHARHHHHNKRNVGGEVASVDAVGKTITLAPRANGEVTTITTDASTIIYVPADSTLANIKTGDHIRVFAKLQPGDTTVTARNILVLPIPEHAEKSTKSNAGFGPHDVVGIVTTTAPGLTITTVGGTSVTVITTDRTHVKSLVAGTFSDITVGSLIQAKLNTETPTAPVAVEIIIAPHHGHGRPDRN